MIGLILSITGFVALFMAIWILHKPLDVHSCPVKCVRITHNVLEWVLTAWAVVIVIQILHLRPFGGRDGFVSLAEAVPDAILEPLSVRAVVGRTVFRSTDVDGIWTRVETRDFIVPSGTLGFEPQVGDEIEFLGNTYEVLAPAGEPCWRWSDAFHTACRIHAKNTGG